MATVLGEPIQMDRARSVSNRYALLGQLGAGGMGQVYRALDRLTGETVALKRVIAQAIPTLVDPTLRLALAHEFQALAGLRHPNIIGVRDYGFDATGQPYFTMELLYNPRTLVAAGQLLATQDKIRLLLPVLHALTYIHRRGIIHRDLKPGNLLVSGQTVKVLDFGLAAVAGQTTPPSGTLRYMAPEVLQGETATVAADLYAVGVIAYELLAGWHPFTPTGQPVSTDLLIHLEPDWSYVDLDPALIAVLQRLLAKQPQERYPDAAAVIAALGEATGQMLPAETVATRESFLQAAPFVGRESELAQLKTALSGAVAGQGSAWLIGGESGVGKSRLLSELRTYALVQGVLVMHGQASSDGGSAYHLWRDILRWLLLLAEPNDLEASVLRPLLPDIADLLGRPVDDAPLLEAKAAQTRLLTTIASLMRRSTARQPLLLLVEDLHWADENSLELLQWLTQPTEQSEERLRSWLLIATYRRGEAPHLPERLPTLQSMLLSRLLPDQVAALSVAMLGEAGQRPHLVHFLHQETEGNTFFIVETLRALAEEAGQLDRIAAMALPNHIFPGGVQQVIQRRLQRVPAIYQPLLQWSAVAGRRLDLALLQSVAPPLIVEQWLTLCANAAVLSWQERYWHFAHDKLREGVLRELTPTRRQQLHQQVAETIRQVYAADLSPHYADLSYHFGQAQDQANERRYLQLAGETAQATYANAAAIEYYQRLLPLLAKPPAQVETLLRLGRVLKLVGRWQEAERHYQQAVEIALATADEVAQAQCYHALGNLLRSRSEYGQALAILLQAQAKFAARAEEQPLCEVLVEIGNVYYHQGDYANARTYMTEALALARAAENHKLTALALHCLGNVTFDQGDYAQTKRFFEESLALRRQIGDKADIASTLNNLGILASYQADYPLTQAYYSESLALRREIGDRAGMAASFNNLGIVAKEQGDLERALTLYQESLAIDLEIGDHYSATYPRGNIAVIYQRQKQYALAHALYTENLHRRQALGDRWGTASTLISLGEVATDQGDLVAAWAHYQAGLRLLQEIRDKQKLAYCLVGLAALLIEGKPTMHQVERATQLAAAAATIAANAGLILESEVQARYERTIARAGALLTEVAYTDAWRQGAAMDEAQVIQFARAEEQQ